MKISMKSLLFAALGLALTSVFVLPAVAHTQEEPGAEPAIENKPESTEEPSIDDLLGLDDDEPGDKEEPKEPDPDDKDETDPKLTRDLDKALTGKQAADQFAQAIEEMEEVAIRLGEESDPGIDTQRMQDQIILKLEQIIASAEKTKSQQKPKPGQASRRTRPARPTSSRASNPASNRVKSPARNLANNKARNPVTNLATNPVTSPASNRVNNPAKAKASNKVINPVNRVDRTVAEALCETKSYR